MQRGRMILSNTSFALNCMLVFLLIFERGISLPPWVQTIGRMHPLLLHFPIVLMVLCIGWELSAGLRKSSAPEQAAIGDWLLLLASFTAAISALMGLLLSKEGGYTQDVLAWHKWGGVFISLLAFAWYTSRNFIRNIKPVLAFTGLTGLVMVVITGHLGADITHGENFLLAPVSRETPPGVLLEDAAVYADMVQPILKSKCISCHNEKKAKGELVMEPLSGLLKGGKNGVLWDSTQKDFGLMLRRIHLPLESKKHMPPAGKPQLTAEEISILYYWIRSGANFTTKLAQLPATDSLRIIASTLFSTIETDDYSFKPADEKKVAKLRNNYRLVTPLATGSPALSVEFFGAQQFKAAQLKELLEIKDQVVSLSLNKMPVNDDDLSTIARFTNLRRLNLSFTNLKGTGLAALQSLKALKQLSLSGTGVSTDALKPLSSLPELTKLYIWNTPAQSQDLAALKKNFKNTIIETGFSGDTVILKLNPPLIENEEQVLNEPTPLHLNHYVKGVAIRYTTDGTEPDSLHASLYNADFLMDKNMTVKARAFKSGWISSDATERFFYRAGYKIDSILLVKPAPDAPYKTMNASILTDGQKGDLNFKSGKWLGFRGQSLEAVLYFYEPHSISIITISGLVNIGGYIMPPQRVEVWAGNTPRQLRLIKTIVPAQPLKEGPAYMKGYELSFKSVKEKYFKVVLIPVPKLPSWHKGKGDRGWVFADEFFLN
ncbi:MAG: hypothetical protein JWP81_2315 [Ferruginibacter sp.]|nr:hypothetical protein [Ferruginibacter sp.]